jgi:hypothetical protein
MVHIVMRCDFSLYGEILLSMSENRWLDLDWLDYGSDDTRTISLLKALNVFEDWVVF